MTISEKDQNTFCKEYGLIMSHHVEGDKSLEERLSFLDRESEYVLRGMKEMGAKEEDPFFQYLSEMFPRMKEDIKEFYK